MFLQPHHLQAAERHVRGAIFTAEEWLRPYPWGLRRLLLDRDAIAKSTFVIRECDVRFKDGTHLSIPSDCEVAPLELKEQLGKAGGELTIYLAVPTLRRGRANIEEKPSADGPRHWIESVECEDENTGGGEQEIQLRRTRCRLLHSRQQHDGYEILPVGRVAYSVFPFGRNEPSRKETDAATSYPQLDPRFVPPLLGLDAWSPLWSALQDLHHTIATRVEQLASMVINRGVALETQVPGDAERVLKLSVLNGAFSYLRSAAFVRGLPPVLLYHELCRLAGQLAIFTPVRRPIDLPVYDHEAIGACFQTVIEYIQLELDSVSVPTFEKRYFERVGERLQAALEPSWISGNRGMYLAVETELKDQECQALLSKLDMKVGSGAQVEIYFRKRVTGLRLEPVARPPRALPTGGGLVYFQVERDPAPWRDVVDTQTLGIRLNMDQASFQGDRVLTVPVPGSNRSTNLQFTLYVI